MEDAAAAKGKEKAKKKEPVEVKTPDFFPSRLAELVGSYIKIDKLVCLLSRRSMAPGIDKLTNFAGVFPGREALDQILSLCPGTIATKNQQVELVLKPAGVSKSKEQSRLKGVIGALTEHIRKILFQHWMDERDQNESASDFEKRAKRQWKDLQSAASWPEELISLEEIILPPRRPITPPAAVSIASDDTSPTRVSSPQRSPSRGKSKIPQLLRDDDGAVSCITLTDRDYASFRFDDEEEADGAEDATANDGDGEEDGMMEAGGFEGAQPAQQGSSRSNAEVILTSVTKLPWYRDQLVYKTVYPPQHARFLPLRSEPPLPQRLVRALETNMGLDVGSGLYRHQALAVDALRRGQHLTLSTATSSGKSLVYNLPVLEAVLTDPSSTALFLFPTKALAQDQLRATNALCGRDGEHDRVILPVVSAICDGDSGAAAREAVKMEVERGGANVILTNPDMLHHTILPQHASFKRIFKSLRYVVIDEGHCYRGTFGAHVACVLRRLVRTCLLYRMHPPQFVVCSATISNPSGLFSSLLPIDALGGLAKLTVVEPSDGGTAQGERLFAMWNPSLTEVGARKLHQQDKNKDKDKDKDKDKEDVARLGPVLAVSSTSSTVSSGPANHYLQEMQDTSSARPGLDLVSSGGREGEVHGEQDSALAAFLEGCEDRFRQPVSWKGAYGDKPRHQAVYREKRAAGWKRSREEEEWEAGLGEGPLARTIRDGDQMSAPISSFSEDPMTRTGGAGAEKKTSLSAELLAKAAAGKWASERERESPFVEIARLLAYLVRLRLRVLCFCGTRNLVEMVNRMARNELEHTYKAPHLLRSIASYRGGYTAQDRRDIESRLFSGQLLGVCATCALELGVDVGALDVTLHLGYPGSISSLWQQAGRAGRGGRPSLSIIVCFDSPVDQYFARFPSKLLRAPVEGVMLGVDNPHIIRGHLLCAAFEERLNSHKLAAAGLREAELWGPAYRDTLLTLLDSGNLEPNVEPAVVAGSSGNIRLPAPAVPNVASTSHSDSVAEAGRSNNLEKELKFVFALAGSAHKAAVSSSSLNLLHTSSRVDSIFERPSRSVNLRLIDPITINIVDTGTNADKRKRSISDGTNNSGGGGVLIDSMSYSRAFFEAFPGSVFYHQAKQYLITSLDLPSRTALCHRVRLDYSTTALNDTVVTIVHDATRHTGGYFPGGSDCSIGGNLKEDESSLPQAQGVQHRPSIISYGTVTVVKKVNGYVKRHIRTRELLEEGEFNLPPLEMETQAVWIDLPLSIKKTLERHGHNVSSSLHAANHAFCSVAAIESLCDPGDLDCEHFGTMALLSGSQPRRMLCYDRRPGGLGICEALVAAGSTTLKKAKEVLQSCECSSPLGKGCPSCLLDGRCSHYNENLSKDGAIMLLGMLYEASRATFQASGEGELAGAAEVAIEGAGGEGAETAAPTCMDCDITPPTSPINGGGGNGKDKEKENEPTPREKRRLALARQARFRDNHSSRGLYVASAWSKAVDETTM